jgi:hypothetical protein
MTAPSPRACSAPDVSNKPMATVATQAEITTAVSGAMNTTNITPSIVVLIIFECIREKNIKITSKNKP